MKQLSLILSLMCFWLSPAFAQKVNIVTEEYPPYNHYDANRKIVGASTEVVEEVFRRAKIEYQMNLYPWPRAYQTALDEANVAIFSIGRNEKRESLFKWVGVIAPYNVYLYKAASRTDITATDVASAKLMKTGVVREDVRTQYLEKEGFKVEVVSDDAANVKKLHAGRIDFFPIDEAGQIGLYKREGLDPKSAVKAIKLEALSTGLYLAFSKKTADDLVNRCKHALEEMQKDGSLEKIKAKYLK